MRHLTKNQATSQKSVGGRDPACRPKLPNPSLESHTKVLVLSIELKAKGSGKIKLAWREYMRN